VDRTVVLVTAAGLGTTSQEDAGFGAAMLEKFFHTLEKGDQKPAAICFYTEGVRCVAEGSPFLMSLGLLEGMGVRLVSCLTCLEHYGLKDARAVGEVGGMDEIVGLLSGAAKVVTL